MSSTLEVIAEANTLISSPLERLVATFRKWLFIPDSDLILAVYGALAANRLPGDPTWLLVVGAPGSGKTESIQPALALSGVHAVGTLTEASLLSGTPKKEHADGAKGGLLRTIGAHGVIVCKDFTSVLSMHRDSRASVLAALREIYDGSWTRHVGTDGGQTLHWEGRVGFIAGCTPTIDRHHAVMASMGERFVMFRVPEVDVDEQARRALEHAGHEEAMRAELAAAVKELFEQGMPSSPKPLNHEDRERLVALATLVVKARSSVERDSYSRDIELVPASEAPTRIVVVLSRMLAGLDAIGAHREDAWRVVTRIGLDCVPALRRALMHVLADGQPLDTKNLAIRIKHPTQTTRRALEDLAAHGVIRRLGTTSNADNWQFTDWTLSRWEAVVPEKSDGDQTVNPATSLLNLNPTDASYDFSGTHTQTELETTP